MLSYSVCNDNMVAWVIMTLGFIYCQSGVCTDVFLTYWQNLNAEVVFYHLNDVFLFLPYFSANTLSSVSNYKFLYRFHTNTKLIVVIR